jgi:uncharacterized protein (TIGR03083 family)
MTRALVGNITEEIAAEYRDLADLLEQLPQTSWDAPTLCAGWRTREVVAHLTMPVRYSKPRFVIELARAKGNFNQLADRCAQRDAGLDAEILLAALRCDKLHSWKPPGGGYDGALTHIVIHGLDITVALGVNRRVPAGRLRSVLEVVATPKSRRFFGPDLSGVELRANNLDWSLGSGAALCGQAEDLALVLCGRKLPTGRLRGDAEARFTATS